MQRIFNLDPQLLQDAIILAVNIFILFLLGSYLLFNPVRNLLKKRQDNVAAEIEAARKSKEEADALKAQYDEKLMPIQQQTRFLPMQERKHFRKKLK